MKSWAFGICSVSVNNLTTKVTKGHKENLWKDYSLVVNPTLVTSPALPGTARQGKCACGASVMSFVVNLKFLPQKRFVQAAIHADDLPCRFAEFVAAQQIGSFRLVCKGNGRFGQCALSVEYSQFFTQSFG
jgi:hypothetical protein